VLSDLSLARCIINSNLHDTLGYGRGFLTESKRSKSTFIMLYLYLEMDVDYLVVDEMFNISKLLDHDCMFSIGANL
jgi:hypothetical protein